MGEITSERCYEQTGQKTHKKLVSEGYGDTGFLGEKYTKFRRTEKGGKLSISDFGGKESVSWWDRELETCSYMFPRGIKIRSVYSKNHKKGTVSVKFSSGNWNIE